MARKQAKRRKQKTSRKLTLPKLRLSRLVAPLVAAGLVFGTYQLSLAMLDREITSLEISGPFQRVTPLQIEEVIADEVAAGFVGADLDQIRERIVALPWIDQARVARRWPSSLSVTVTEQVPAALWGERGLLNIRGELFVTDVRHVPPELPKLSGPEGSSAEVAARYLEVRDRLIPVGLDVRSVHMDARGSWDMTLANGIVVRLGRRNVAERTDLFLDIVADIITGRATEIDYVDMRYGNGFTIGWKSGSKTPVADPSDAEQKLLASRGRE